MVLRSDRCCRGTLRTSLALVLLGVFAAVLASGRPVHAQETPRLSGQVTDLAGVLGGNTSSIQPALDRLQKDHGIQLFVLFVNTTGSQSATQFTQNVAALNTFGKNDALLVVAIQDTSYATWFSKERTDITDAEIDTVTEEDMIPRLQLGDWSGAAVAFANGIGEVTGESGSGGSGTTVLIVILVLVGLALLGGLVFFLVRRARAARARQDAEDERDRETGELAKEANQLLLQTDDAMREATQELGFAEAQFSETDVAPFRKALEAAKLSLSEAFTIRQQLDDETPEDPETRRKMLEQIIAKCQAANAAVTEQMKHIDELRALEQNAPALLDALPGLADTVEQSIPRAEGAFARLEAVAPATRQPVEGNIVEARKRVEFARKMAAAGQAAVAEKKNAEAAVAARDAQAAIAEATRLVDAVTALDESVAKARASLGAEIASAAADVAAASEIVERQGVQDQRDDVARAQAMLEQARQESGKPQPDVLGALKAATDANAAADAILEHVRTLEEQRKRDAAAADSALQQAETAYRQASDFILSRGSGVGREARTRLAESERHLQAARALIGDDVTRGVAEARQAHQLASDALNLAQADFSRYDSGRGGPGLPAPSGPLGGSGGFGGLGGTLGGIILGGILTGAMRGGGGFGGTQWGGSGGGRRGGGGGFRVGGGGFRVGGGGGGRVRGGRW